MEEKKFDLNSIIGFVLIGAIMLWWMYSNQPTPEELKAKAETEQVQKDTIAEQQKKDEKTATVKAPIVANDSLSLADAKNALGNFAYSASLPSATDNETVLENKVLKLNLLRR